MILLPEIKIKALLDAYLGLIYNDYINTSNKTKTFIYKLFNGNKVDNYDFYLQAVKILSRSKDDPRKLEVRTFFDRSRASIPTIHINLPAESPIGDGIGFDPNYEQPEFNDTDSTFQETVTRTFATKYNIIVTSDNQFEVVILYYALKAIMISNYESLEMNGLRLPKFSGQDMILRDDLVPNAIYARSLSLDTMYEFTVPNLYLKSFPQNVEFISQPYSQFDEPYYGSFALGELNVVP